MLHVQGMHVVSWAPLCRSGVRMAHHVTGMHYNQYCTRCSYSMPTLDGMVVNYTLVTWAGMHLCIK